MQLLTMRDAGALVRTVRKQHGMSQADLAAQLGTGRDWVVRLEQGQPRLEAQKVLDAFAVLHVPLCAGEPTGSNQSDDDPFHDLLTSDL
jgi:transcriptional regulator with XRE-family HTH domain